MRALLKNLLRLALLPLLILSCKTAPENTKAKIAIRSATQHNAEVKISRTKYLDDVTLVKSKTDSSGFCSFEVTVSKPFFTQLQIGNKYSELYLSPNDDVLIVENGEAYITPLVFSGRGATVNNYISWVNSTSEKIKWDKGKGIGELSPTDFIHRHDSLKKVIENFHRSYLDSAHIPEAMASLLARKNHIRILEIEHEYKFYQKNSLINEKWDALKKGHTYLGGILEKEVDRMAKELPFDTTLLTDGFGEYPILLNFYWQMEINLTTAERIGPNGDFKQAPILTNALIKKNNYPEGIREFLLAWNLRYWLLALGITQETDSIFNDFKRSYVHSNYLPVLNRSYEEWLAVAPGKPAPEFEATTLEGKKVSIHDLRGKIVYIDVWATWCGPCLEEIPSSKELQMDFAKESNVQFVNLSIDRDRAAWERFVTKDTTWKGLHLNIGRENVNAFYQTYKIFGVPAFILIDQNGNIITMKASRPSDKKVKAEIRQALAKIK